MKGDTEMEKVLCERKRKKERELKEKRKNWNREIKTKISGKETWGRKCEVTSWRKRGNKEGRIK